MTLKIRDGGYQRKCTATHTLISNKSSRDGLGDITGWLAKKRGRRNKILETPRLKKKSIATLKEARAMAVSQIARREVGDSRCKAQSRNSCGVYQSSCTCMFDLHCLANMPIIALGRRRGYGQDGRGVRVGVGLGHVRCRAVLSPV